jgi:hypothetical protein
MEALGEIKRKKVKWQLLFEVSQKTYFAGWLTLKVNLF